jgi:hypothetical protein
MFDFYIIKHIAAINSCYSVSVSQNLLPRIANLMKIHAPLALELGLILMTASWHIYCLEESGVIELLQGLTNRLSRNDKVNRY